MKRIGAHVSAAGGVFNAPLNAEKIGAKAFALFTKNQKQWKAKPLTDEDIRMFKAYCDERGFTPEHILPHDSYLINLGNPDAEKRAKSLDAFIDELQRCEQLGLKYLNFHPGSHLGKVTEDECLKIIADGVSEALSKTTSAVAVIENTSGMGNHVGYRFEHLARIIEMVDQKDRVGFCIDTCHAYTAGYDFRTPEAYEKTMHELDSIVGLHYLKGMHLNDTQKALGSRVDRHASIGEGELGVETFRLIVNDPRLEEIPLILETPDETIWDKEIALLYSLSSNT